MSAVTAILDEQRRANRERVAMPDKKANGEARLVSVLDAARAKWRTVPLTAEELAEEALFAASPEAWSANRAAVREAADARRLHRLARAASPEVAKKGTGTAVQSAKARTEARALAGAV